MKKVIKSDICQFCEKYGEGVEVRLTDGFCFFGCKNCGPKLFADAVKEIDGEAKCEFQSDWN